jgi:ribosomal protein S18 acetylase RimI-like enzyme
MTVRHALRGDLDELTDTLVDAFTGDPIMAWMYPDPVERERGSRAFLRVMLEIGFPHGHTYAVGAHNEAVAVWSPPDVELFDDAALGRLGPVLEDTLGARTGSIVTGLMQIAAARPQDRGPHFYLSEIGTSGRAQGRGLGSLLMAEVLDRCDRQGLGAYLESSNTRNVPFYERHGFEVVTEVWLSDDCVARPMWRDPTVV